MWRIWQLDAKPGKKMKKWLLQLCFLCSLVLPIFNPSLSAEIKESTEITSLPANLPVIVNVGLNFLHLVSIDEYEETFTADIYLFTEWKDSRLAYSADKGNRPRTYLGDACKRKISEIWWPDFEFVNAGLPDITNSYLAIYPDGTVQYNQGITATFRNPFDYRKLPFDKQRLQIILSSFSWDDKEVLFRAMPQSVSASKKMKAIYDEIRILGIEYADQDHAEHETPTPSGYSEFIVTLTIQRAPLFYSYQVFFPLLIVIGLCCAVFYIPPHMIGDRIVIVLTCVLVFIATKFLINQDLPKIGYLTFIDKVFFIAYFFSGLVAVTCIIEHRLWVKKDPHVDMIPKVAHFAGPLLFLLACAVLVLVEIL